jgi:GH15 family glucan-1,4-alpha-glucosidase
MCWAACDRLARIAAQLSLPDRAQAWADRAKACHQVIVERAWNEDRQTFVATFGGDNMDASLLLLADLGFLAPEDPVA